jgi:hypothetical protein
MSSNNRNKQYLIDMILKRRGHKDPQDPELEEEREELRKKSVLDLNIINRELREEAENTPPSFLGRLFGF